MNLALLDPFAVASDFPETLTETLSYGYSTYVEFNEKGDYLASGLADGTIVIIDAETNNSSVILRGHTRAITQLSWSKCGRYLLSASRDWKVNLWDLSTQKVVRTVSFESPAWNCVMVPGHIYQFVAALFDDDPVFVDFENEPVITRLQTEAVSDLVDSAKLRARKHLTLTASITPDGSHVVCGTNRGWMNVIDIATLKTAYSVKVCDANIKGIEIAPNGHRLIVNAGDRMLRQYAIQEGYKSVEIEQKYQDVVNRIQYNSIKFNHDSEYVCASTLGSSHDIYIWETRMGSLVKVLEGSNEELLQVDWNYRRCAIVSTGMDTGMIYLWEVIAPQKWSNLAPDFEEIEENIDYEEKEDEFDRIDELAESERQAGEQETVDVVTREAKDARGFPFLHSFIIDTPLE